MARSNKWLTNFAIGFIQSKMELPIERVAEVGNTRAESFFSGPSVLNIVIQVCGNKVFELTYDILASRPSRMFVYHGYRFDGLGRPTGTTRERLNGILDYLGNKRFLPEGVRVFLDQDTCFLGRKERKTPLNSQREVVILSPHSEDLIFSDLRPDPA